MTNQIRGREPSLSTMCRSRGVTVGYHTRGVATHSVWSVVAATLELLLRWLRCERRRREDARGSEPSWPLELASPTPCGSLAARM